MHVNRRYIYMYILFSIVPLIFVSASLSCFVGRILNFLVISICLKQVNFVGSILCFTFLKCSVNFGWSHSLFLLRFLLTMRAPALLPLKEDMSQKSTLRMDNHFY